MFVVIWTIPGHVRPSSHHKTPSRRPSSAAWTHSSSHPGWQGRYVPAKETLNLSPELAQQQMKIRTILVTLEAEALQCEKPWAPSVSSYGLLEVRGA